MSTSQIVVAAITALVAVYGAILATYNLLVERAARTPKLRLSLQIGTKHPDGPEYAEPSIFVRVGNAGRMTIHLAMWGVSLDGQNDLPFGAHPTRRTLYKESLPAELVPGKGVVFDFPLSALTTMAQREAKLPSYCEAYALDQLRNRFKSEPIMADWKSWSELVEKCDPRSTSRI